MFCHEVMLKLMPQYWNEHSVEKINSALWTIKNELPCVFSAEALRNCVVRDINYDLLVKVRLDTRENLQQYLNHPKHINLSREFAPYLLEKAAVDYILD